MKWSEVKSFSSVRLFVTPWTVVYQAPPSTRFSRQEYWSGLPFPSPGHLPNPGIKPGSPALQADALMSEPPGKPLVDITSLNLHIRMHIARAFKKRVQIHQPLGCKPSSPQASPCEALWATEKGKFPVKANGREENSSMQSKEFISLWLNKRVLWGRVWIGVWPSQDPQHMWPLLRAGKCSVGYLTAFSAWFTGVFVELTS